ncbi:MAG: hypothetical protein Q7U74_07525, partial [Saprospiraceae bacterium]|nr:hypothetical protein [Saprospiraceae bacterium]
GFFAQYTPGTAFRDTQKRLQIRQNLRPTYPCRISVLAYFCGSFSKTEINLKSGICVTPITQITRIIV